MGSDPSEWSSLLPKVLRAAAIPAVGISVTLLAVLAMNSTRPERVLPHEYAERVQRAAEQRADQPRLVTVGVAGLQGPGPVQAAPTPAVAAETAPQATAQQPPAAVETAAAPTPAPEPAEAGVQVAAAQVHDHGPLDPEAVKRGKRVYMSCIACHGRTGTGVKGVGKDLIASEFVLGSSDEELVAFIKQGRNPGDPGNTTGLAMPPKGGNPSLKDEQLGDVVAYIRSLAGPTPTAGTASAKPAAAAAPAPAQEPAAAATETAAPAEAVATPASLAEPVALDPEAVKRGKRVYMSCIACHGRTGTGVKGVGKDLIASEFVLGSSDEELVAFIKQGRNPGDPGNTTGLAMPPKGGNPSLKDEQLGDVVAYIRSLAGHASGGQATGSTQ